MHPFDRAIIEYETQMWNDILRQERSIWARIKAWFRRYG